MNNACNSTQNVDFIQDIEVIRVIDGDTIEINIKNMSIQQLHTLLENTIKIRIIDIDTSEFRDVCDAQKNIA